MNDDTSVTTTNAAAEQQTAEGRKGRKGRKAEQTPPADSVGPPAPPAPETPPAPAPEKEDTASAVLFPTREDAEKAGPPAGRKSKNLKVFGCIHHGETRGYAWGTGYNDMFASLARMDGWEVSLDGATRTVSKEAVAAKLAAFSDEELAALGLSRR